MPIERMPHVMAVFLHVFSVIEPVMIAATKQMTATSIIMFTIISP